MDTISKPDGSVRKVESKEGTLGGMPVIAGTRIPAETILAEVHAGKSRFEIFRHYPSLPLDGIEACIAWESAGRPVWTTPS